MKRTLHLDGDQRSGEYRDIIDYLFSLGRDRYGSAANAVANIVRQSPEFQSWKEQVQSTPQDGVAG